MNLCREFVIKDLFDYMIMNETDILEEIGYGNLSVMIDVIQIGNKCSEEEAENVLYSAIDAYGIEQVIEELAYEVIGYRPDENDKKQNSKEFKSFSDILESFYNDIQSVDNKLSISEFMHMSTRYMFRYADGLQKRFINNKNKELQSQYMNAMLIGSMLAGKLKECPQLDDTGAVKKEDKMEKMRAFFRERRGING